MYKYFKKVGSTKRISSWKSKGLSDEVIKTLTTSDNSLDPALSYISNEIRVKFDGGCLEQDKTTFTHEKTVNIYIVYEISFSTCGYDDYPVLENSLFDAARLVKNAHIDKSKCSGYIISFDRRGIFSFPTGGFGCNAITFGVDMSSSVHADSKKEDILILGEGPTQGLDDTALIGEKNYSINFTESRKEFCLSLHYNGANSYLFVNGTEIHKFKAKDSEILGNISKDFSVDNMKKTGLNGYVYDLVFIMMLLQLMIY